MAGDAVAIAPDIYSVVLENDRVRVLEIETEPGGSSAEHSHPDMVLYAVTDCAWDLTAPSGETVTAEIPAGATIFLEATTHSAEDLGSSGSHAIAIELKWTQRSR